MKNFEQIAETPETLGGFLAALPVADGPWDAEFRRVFCTVCSAENCEGANCPHGAARNNPLWWLIRAVEAKRGAEQTAEREAQPGFICFSSAATENGEDPEKAPSVSVIMRVERMDVDEKTLLCLKRIQQKAAAEVNALLGW